MDIIIHDHNSYVQFDWHYFHFGQRDRYEEYTHSLHSHLIQFHYNACLITATALTKNSLYKLGSRHAKG